MKNRSESMKTIAPKLLEIQKNLDVVKHNKSAYNYTYADLEACVNELVPKLHAANMLYWHSVDYVDGVELIETVIMCAESTEWISSKIKLLYPEQTAEWVELRGKQKIETKVREVGPDPQEQGSAITYSKRYGLCGLAGLLADGDADGANKRKQEAANKANWSWSESEESFMFKLMKDKKVKESAIKEYMNKEYNIDSFKDLNKAQYDKIISFLQRK